MEHPFLMFLDHTERRSTVGRTPLVEWSARRRDFYLTAHNTQQIYIPPLGFEPTVSAGERPKTYPRLRPRGHWGCLLLCMLQIANQNLIVKPSRLSDRPKTSIALCMLSGWWKLTAELEEGHEIGIVWRVRLHCPCPCKSRNLINVF